MFDLRDDSERVSTAWRRCRTLPESSGASHVPVSGGRRRGPRHAHAGREIFERTGQPFITDNRGGASGAIGTTIAAKAAPDGYTVLVASSIALAVNPALQGQTHKDILRDFAAILRLPDVRKRLSQEAAGSTPEQLSTQIEREIEKWTKIVKAANIRPDQ